MKTEPVDRSVSEWVLVFRDVYYFTQNAQRDVFRIFTGLVGSAGHFWKRVYRGNDYEEACSWLARVFAWYAALVNQLRIEVIEDLIWAKFPGHCPFCRAMVCDCGDEKAPMNRGALRSLAGKDDLVRPTTLFEWQQMFDSIYDQSNQRIPKNAKRTDDKTQALLLAGNKLVEELGELGEALVVAPYSALELHDEIADVFAWICGAANSLPVAFEQDAPLDLGAVIWNQYPDQCDRCETNPCICTLPPIQRLLEREGLSDMRGLDALTGVFARGRLDVDLSRHSKNDIQRICLAFFDVDDFKNFNSMPGAWQQGDLVLQTVAERAQSSVGKAARVYRYGGDEFALVATNLESAEARELVQSMHAEISRDPIPAVSSIVSDAGPVSISVGAVSVTEWGGNVNQLIGRAQAAAAELKATEKGKVHFVDY